MPTRGQVRKRDLNKNGADNFHRNQHQRSAEAQQHFLFCEDIITSQEGEVLNGLVRILHYQVEMLKAAQEANRVQQLQKSELLETSKSLVDVPV
jgi:hypothetical protein